MKGSLAECIDYIASKKERTMLLIAGNEFEVIKARSIRAENAPIESIVGVFTRHVAADVILFEAG